MDRTLVICKPDAVERGLVGDILSRFERRLLRIVAAELRYGASKRGSPAGSGSAASASGAGPFLRFFIDQGVFPFLINSWLFPTTPVDLFATFEKRIDLLVDRKLEVAIDLSQDGVKRLAHHRTW